MRASAIALLALAGCGGVDPCSGQSGTCVTVTVSSTHISRLDDLELTASGVVTGPRSSKTGSERLPIKLALHLPATASGTLSLSVVGELAGTVAGSGHGSVGVTPGAHVALPIDLEPGQPAVGADLSNGVAADLSLPPAGADLSVTGDGAPPPVTFTPTAPVTQGDVASNPLLGDFTLPAGSTLFNSDTGAISNGATALRAANGVFIEPRGQQRHRLPHGGRRRHLQLRHAVGSRGRDAQNRGHAADRAREHDALERRRHHPRAGHGHQRQRLHLHGR